jgi:hypothetical protein
MDTAYAAGIVDADGCIMVVKYQKAAAVQVEITNTFIPLLEEIQAAWGGTVVVRNSRGNGLRCGGLRITGDEAIVLLEAIRPYLRVKEVEAWLALEFRANCKKYSRGTRLPAEEVALREGYYLASKYARHNRMELVRR